MSKNLQAKKAELEKLRKEIEEQEAIEKYNKEKAEAYAQNLYKPLATAIVRTNVWYISEYNFKELGDGEWYTASQLLGDPDLRKNTKVVLLDTGDGEYWFSEKTNSDEDYFGIEDDEVGMEDTHDNRKYLKDIVYVK